MLAKLKGLLEYLAIDFVLKLKIGYLKRWILTEAEPLTMEVFE